MNKAVALLTLFPDASPLRDFRVVSENGVQRIEHWALDAPVPTDEELEAAWEESQS